MKKLFMKVNGEKEQKLERVKDCKFGKMVQYMRVGGLTTKPTGEEDLFMQNVTFMKEIGWMTRLMGMVNIYIWMVQHIKVFGMKTDSTGKE